MNDTVHQTFELLKHYGMVRSQRQFSARFLGRSPNYYGAISAMGRDPAVGSVATLATRVSHWQEKIERLAEAQKSGELKEVADALDEQREKLWLQVEELAGGDYAI